MPSFLSNGIGLSYEVHGAGRPVLCIHGFGSSGKVNWVDTGFALALEKYGSGKLTWADVCEPSRRLAADGARYGKAIQVAVGADIEVVLTQGALPARASNASISASTCWVCPAMPCSTCSTSPSRRSADS